MLITLKRLSCINIIIIIIIKCPNDFSQVGNPTSHGENSPHLSGLPSPTDRVTRLVEVPHLSCEQNQEKRRNCMERLVTPPSWGTSLTRGPPPLCESHCLRARRPIRPALISGFSSIKRLGVFILPLDGMLVHRRVTPSITPVPNYTPGWREAP